MYTTASGIQIPQGTDAFNPPAQFKAWADAEAEYDNLVNVNLDSERTALTAPKVREGVHCWVRSTKRLWVYQDAAWVLWMSPRTAFTPVWDGNYARGNGTVLLAEYVVNQGQMWFRATEKLGSNSIMGTAAQMSVPGGFTAAVAAPEVIGQTYILDAGTGRFAGRAVLESATQIRPYYDFYSGSAPINAGGTPTSQLPMVWAVNDQLTIDGVIRLA